MWEDDELWDGDAEDPLVIRFGEDLLRFVLNGQLPEEVADGDEPRQAALQALRFIDQSVPVTDSVNQRHFVVDELVRGGAASGMTPANAMRTACGGDLPEPQLESPDPVARALYAMAVYSFAVELLPPPTGDAEFTSMRAHDRFVGLSLRAPFRDCYEHVLEDPELGLLFPPPAPHVGSPRERRFRSADLFWSSGNGGSTLVGGLPPRILCHLFTTMRLDETLDVMAVPDYVTRTVATLRRLAAKRQTRVPLVVPLGNFEFDEDEGTVRLDNGKIMPARQLADRVPGVTRMDDAVLILETNLKLLEVVPQGAGQESDSEPSEYARRVERRAGEVAAASHSREMQITAARLAVALATREGPLVAPTVRHREIINPFLHAGRGYASGPSSGMPYEELAPSAFPDVLRFSQVANGLPASMALGARRLVSAIGERMDPLDAFVDAVVCWENFLGAETEVTFRVPAALARLVEPEDLAARRALFRELQELYRVRSRLVHGAKEPTVEDATVMRNRAVWVALAALEAIAEQPELWGADNSGERSRRVLLGT